MGDAVLPGIKENSPYSVWEWLGSSFSVFGTEIQAVQILSLLMKEVHLNQYIFSKGLFLHLMFL